MRNRKILLSVSLIGLFASAASFAADHTDSPATVSEPAADIADLYAWMTTDASKLNLALTVNPFATSKTQFSDAVQYAIHVNSSAGYGEAQNETLIQCQFKTTTEIECWIGDEYLSGDISSDKGVSNDDGSIKIFAGLRNDPFFFELGGFLKTVDTVISAAPSLQFDQDFCPMLDADTSALLVGQLQSSPDGSPAKDSLAGANIMALVVQVDKTKVNKGGDILSVWASTHRR